jgi:transcription elongation factor Elf1
MNENIKFTCATCGGGEFKPVRGVKSWKDFIGASCANCGRELTEDDIKAQALKIAEDAARRAFGEGGLKIKI